MTKRKGLMTSGVCRVESDLHHRRVGGFAADASIVTGTDRVPDDLAANHHRVGGKAANPTVRAAANT